MYAGCNVESKSDPSLNVTALRTTILKAVSDGETKFQGLVLSSQTEEFPIPDGTGRQFLSEYGDFPVFCVNMDLEVKRFTTFQLFPMAANVANKKRKTSCCGRFEEGSDHCRVPCESKQGGRRRRRWMREDEEDAGLVSKSREGSQHFLLPYLCEKRRPPHIFSSAWSLGDSWAIQHDPGSRQRH